MTLTYQMPNWSTTTAATTTNANLPAAPRRREPVIRPPLADDPCLDATIEELDLAMGACTPDSYLAPPPLMDRLFLPRSYGRWSQVLHLESAASPTADPIGEATLGDLDGGLLDGPVVAVLSATPPPLMARLPGPRHSRARSTASDWTVSATLILLMFAGAAAGALVFHERLSDIVSQWETRLE